MRSALVVEALSVAVNGKAILRDVSLEVPEGETVALLGPNGSGKSTLMLAVAGHPRYEVREGEIRLRGRSLVAMPPHERAALGLFLAFQQPVELEGIRAGSLLSLISEKREGASPDEAVERLSLGGGFLERYANVGFSGGERKVFETVQLLVAEPYLALLDEPDSGLDVDGTRRLCDTLSGLDGLSALVVSHGTRLFEHVEPSAFLVMRDGRIVARGGREVLETVEREGFGAFS